MPREVDVAARAEKGDSENQGLHRQHPYELAIDMAYNIAQNAKDSLAGNSDLANNQIFDQIKGSMKQGVFDYVAGTIEADLLGKVIRDKNGDVAELTFDNDDPKDGIKVDIKIVGDRVTINGKTEAELDLQEQNFVDKFTKALAENPHRRLPDGSSLNPAEQKLVYEIESAIAKGDLNVLKEIAPSLLSDPKTANRITVAVDRDLKHAPIKVGKASDGKDYVAVSDGYDSVLIGADGQTKVYENKLRADGIHLEEPSYADGPTDKDVVRSLSRQTGEHVRRLMQTYESSGIPGVREPISPEKLADRYIRSRQALRFPR